MDGLQQVDEEYEERCVGGVLEMITAVMRCGSTRVFGVLRIPELVP